MKIITFLIFILIFYSNLYSQEITLNFVPASSSEKIDSILVKEVASGDTIVLKKLSEFQVNAQKGTLYHFETYSGNNITVVADTPMESKEYIVEFHKCQDKDGRNYKIVQIGDQWWMAENLAYLPEVMPPSPLSRFEPKYYVYNYYETDVAEAKSLEVYRNNGVIYNWLGAMQSCPEGWHVPALAEWEKLFRTIRRAVGPYEKSRYEWFDVGQHLKSSSGWFDEKNGLNDWGFNGKPSGIMWAEAAKFLGLYYETRWWTSEGAQSYDDPNLQEKYYVNLYYYFNTAFIAECYMDGGNSLRCVKSNAK